MIIHPVKTKRIVIATRQRHQLRPLQLQRTLEKTRIEQVYEHRVLGVITDNNRKWQFHLNNVCKTVCKTVSKHVFLLSQLRHYVYAKTR